MKLSPNEQRLLFITMAVGILGGAILGYLIGSMLGATSPSALDVDIVTGATVGLAVAVLVLFGVLKPEIMERERARIK